jgi:hypothetical protein
MLIARHIIAVNGNCVASQHFCYIFPSIAENVSDRNLWQWLPYIWHDGALNAKGTLLSGVERR